MDTKTFNAYYLVTVLKTLLFNFDYTAQEKRK